MQPDPPPDYRQPGAVPQHQVAGWPPAPGAGGSWGQPSGPAGLSPAAPAPRRGRPGLVALVAVLVEIIVIAAADNQSVAERVSKAALGDRNSLGYDFALALLTYQWRFSPATGDQFHSLYGQWALLAVLLVLTAFLVVLAARGGAGFARVFFMTWAVVIAATGLGAVTRAAVVDGRILQGASRFQFALFSDIGPSQYVFVAGLALGLVVAVAAGLTAVAVRRDEAVAAPADAVEPGSDQREDAPTTQIERAPSEPDPA